VGTTLGVIFLAVCCVVCDAQESKPGADEALDNLIEKLTDSPPSKPDAKPEAKPAKEQAKPKPPGEGGSKPGDGGDVAPQDQELDSLLEKLGESQDEPDAADSKKPRAGGDGQDKDEGSKSPQPKPDQLGKKDQELDERLEELTGRRKKKKSGPDDEGSGPVSEVVKQMREIEQRLGKPDTGEETQEKQKQIIKRLETMIEQARQSGSSSSSRMKTRQVRQAGQKPGGSRQGQETGTNAGGAPLAKPAKPNNPRSLAGGKDIWGHLPPELRQEMENSFKEEALPDKIELIKRYYLSVSKNKPVREE
jgi:hypothetical protein